MKTKTRARITRSAVHASPLMSRAKSAADERVAVRESAWEAAWEPQEGPQTLALESTADITGYGGAAGGGKTDLICGLAATKHSKSIVFRREYPQIKDIIGRAKELAGVRYKFNGNDNLLTFASGKTLEFGAVQREANVGRYKGRPHDLKAFDEATEFTEFQVRFLLGWLRTTKPGQRTRGLLTFNPPTDEAGAWVIRYFAPWLDPHHPNPAHPGELRWFAMLADAQGEVVEQEVEAGDPIVVPVGDKDSGKTETVYPSSRTFIPARLSDNKYLAENGEYERTLMSMPEPLRSMLLKGDFNATRAGNPWQVIPTAWVEAAIERGKKRTEATVSLTAVGLDVAHGGGDKTVIARRYGDWFPSMLKYPGVHTPDGKSAALLTWQAFDPKSDAYINVDAIGYGASAHERLADDVPEGYGLRAYAVNVAASDTHKKRNRYTDKSGKYTMRNLRAEMYWRLREALDPENNSTLCLPDDRELLADLCAPTFKITPQGFQIEEKADIKTRLSRSPDCGDAVALAMLPPQSEGWATDKKALEKMAGYHSPPPETDEERAMREKAEADLLKQPRVNPWQHLVQNMTDG